MMKASKNVHRWRPLVGVIAVGALAFGLSLRLEGAPAPGGSGKAADRAVAVTAKEAKEARAVSRIDRISGDRQQTAETFTFGNLANRLNGEIPVMPVIVVDYRDDDATRMRDAGLLRGPLPLPTVQQNVAGGGCPPGKCSFAIECDDGNACTGDTCDFPLGPSPVLCGGDCNNTPVPNGSDGGNGDQFCEGHFGLLCGGCDDGLFCNGTETCQGGVCSAGTPPCPTSVCSESLNLCHPTCTVDADCVNLNDKTVLHCNGAETCQGGVCFAGTNPCGSGGLCGEKKCRLISGLPSGFPDFCTATQDCVVESGVGECDIPGPVCVPGRCCIETTPGTPEEPSCIRRVKCDDVGGGPCITNSCDNAGGFFYGTDEGKMEKLDQQGLQCPPTVSTGGSDVPLNCPKYSSGVAPFGAFTQLLGPISDSPFVNPTFGVALQKLGDDYKLSNDPGPGSDGFFKLDFLRFVGGMVVPDRISFEIYDANGNFIEDLFFSAQTTFGLFPVSFEPAVTIPSEGFIVARVASSFSSDARIVWAATDAVDVGDNVNTTLWINNGSTTVASNLGVLAFELEGTKTTAPGGACCTGALGACDNAVLPWVCKGGVGNIYLGDGVLCAVCDTGPNSGQYCRRCSNDALLPCNKDADCGGTNTCIPTNSACDQTAGTALCVAEQACSEGACCNPTTGQCTIDSETNCNTAGGNYQGNGTDCDADNGHDSGEQHCCPQPLSSYTGGDNCGDAIVHVITVPPQGDVKVLTITGDNSAATSTIANPDICFLPSTDPNADPGWWEAFSIVDNCAMVRLDHCCSDPLERPTWSIIYDSCPCGAFTLSSPNPYKDPEAAFSRGLPYCAEDDNLWQSFPLLKAGTYYYPVYSALAGGHGEYQLHISVEACPLAACCIGDSCTDGVNKLECDDLGGFFLAPPNKIPSVGACVDANAPCDTGSCCTGPGQCEDLVLGTLMDPADCATLQGNYVGGVRCKGGVCAVGSPPESCAVDDDCPSGEGPCLEVGAGSKTQQSPCPICEFQNAGQCQLFDDILSFALSDRHLGDDGLLAADDFVPLGTTLTDVCVWGFYINGDPTVPSPQDDCGPDVSADHFRVRVYTNDDAPPAGNGRMPKTLVGESTATSQRGKLDKSVLKTRIGNDMYGYQMQLDTPITGLVSGQVYWLEVSNDPTISGPPMCLWFWSSKTQTSSSYSFGGTDAGYAPGFESPFDQAFCTNTGLTPSTLGAQVGACCFCNGSCQTKTLVDCNAAVGIWHIDEQDCSSVVCPSGAPANDNCVAPGGAVPTISTGTFTVINNCATTDGYGPITSDFGSSQIEFDMWYYFIAPSACDLEVNMCATGFRFDSMFAVYSNCAEGDPGTCDPTVCPPCPLLAGGPAISNATLAGIGQDESCDGVADGGPGVWIASEQITRNAIPGECFLLRIGSFPGSRGTSSVSVICPGGGERPPDPVADPTGIDKPRFISFYPTPPAATAAAVETAIRVNFTTLHNVQPPYTAGASIRFTAFEGQAQYVGPPVQYVESVSSGVQFYASKLQCTPDYRDWSTVGLLAVTGEAITPSSSYSVENLAASCLGQEGSASCSSGGTSVSETPLAIATGRWGDVVASFQLPTPPVSQPDFTDIGALVNKFKSAPGAPIKARALLAGEGARGLINLTPDLGFGHISACVDGFKGLAYPYKIGKCTGAQTTACTTDADCGANGPCIMCP